MKPIYTLLVIWSMLLCTTYAQSTTCPPAASVSPCVCRDNNDGVTVFLNCYNQNLDDTKISQILNSFLSTSGVSPLGRLDLFFNKLTKVPVEIPQFPQLDLVYLYRNSIDSVKSGAFNFAKTLVRLDLYDNQITAIEPGAFQGNYGNGSYIYLYNNLLTRFESGVFQSVLERMEPHYPLAYVDMSNNPIDCVTDACHLAWLIRDNRNLLISVFQARCSNGTTFEQLDPTAYTSCPASNGTSSTTTSASSSTAITGSTTPSGPFTCPTPDGLFANPSSCDSFYMCINNVPYLFDCPLDGNGDQLVFNPSTGQCDVVANVPSCIKPFECPKPDGTYPNPASCKSFYMCINGIPYLFDCPVDGSGNQLVFNPSINQCDYPINVPGCNVSKNKSFLLFNGY